jgi:hypothetical protein
MPTKSVSAADTIRVDHCTSVLPCGEALYVNLAVAATTSKDKTWVRDLAIGKNAHLAVLNAGRDFLTPCDKVKMLTGSNRATDPH